MLQPYPLEILTDRLRQGQYHLPLDWLVTRAPSPDELKGLLFWTDYEKAKWLLTQTGLRACSLVLNFYGQFDARADLVMAFRIRPGETGVIWAGWGANRQILARFQGEWVLPQICPLFLSPYNTIQVTTESGAPLDFEARVVVVNPLVKNELLQFYGSTSHL